MPIGAEAPADTLQYGAMLMGLGGGLALFLHGMHLMTQALTVAAGPGMKQLLGVATRNRFTAAGAGTIVTAVLQSSSVVTVLVVGFTSAGLLTASKAAGVIIGANVGTTITAQIIAFKISAYSLALIGLGFLLQALARRPRVKHLGATLLGLGLIFFGMNLMSEAMAPLRTHQPFLDLMQNLRHPLAGAAIGALFTALVQSSSVTTGIVIVMASQGLLDLRTGIALIFGANIGTCVTALLATIGKPREALRVAIIHIVFNVLGVVVWIGLIPQFVWLLSSPAADNPEAAADVPRQIANAHTLFNVGNALLFIWFTTPLAGFAKWLVPDRAVADDADGTPRFLDPFYLSQPDLALDRVRSELAHLAGLSLAMLRPGLPASLAGDDRQLTALAGRDEQVDGLHGAIIHYLARLSQQDLVEPQPARLQASVSIANYLENLADVAETSLVAAPGTLDGEIRRLLSDLHTAVLTDGERTLQAVANEDQVLAALVIDGKARCRELVGQLQRRNARCLANDAGHADLKRFRWANDQAEALDRSHALLRRVCRQLLSPAPSSP